MAPTPERLARVLPTLSEGIARGSGPAADKAIAQVLQVIIPLALSKVEVTCSDQEETRAEVDWQGTERGTPRPTLESPAEPCSGRGLDRADEAAREPSDLLAHAIQLLHRRVVALRHMPQMFFGDVHGL